MSTFANSDQTRLYVLENAGAFLTKSGWAERPCQPVTFKTREAACKARDKRIAKGGSALVRVVSLCSARRKARA